MDIVNQKKIFCFYIWIAKDKFVGHFFLEQYDILHYGRSGKWKKIATEWQWEKIIIHTTTTKNNKKIKKKKFSNIGKSICLFFFTFLHWLRHSNLRKVKPLKTKQKMKKNPLDNQLNEQTEIIFLLITHAHTHKTGIELLWKENKKKIWILILE